MLIPFRWRRRIKVFMTYVFLVCFVEYLLLLRYEQSVLRDEIGSQVLGPVTDPREGATGADEFPDHRGNRTAEHSTNGSRSAEKDLKEVDTSTEDRTKFLLMQQRLSSCYEANMTDSHLTLCLEMEYLRMRGDVIKLAAEKARRSVGQGVRQAIARGSSQTAALNAARLAARGLSEEDHPDLVRTFYSRRETKVSPYLYDFVAKPSRDCDPDTHMVIIVHSFHPYADRRHAIRETWGGVALGKHAWPHRTTSRKMKLVFMLGTHHDERQNVLLREEIKEFDDIVQGNFYDAYTNMTLKSLLGFKYILKTCPHARVLLKSDDDMFINLPYVQDILQRKNLTRSIMGPRNSGSRVYRAGKWKVSRELFPFHTYPTYESGAAYVITGDLVRDLYETAEYVPPFHVDDVYITGVLGRILGVNHEKQEGFAFWTDKPLMPCDVINNVKVTGTKMTPERLRKLWETLVSDNQPQCPAVS